MSLAYGRLRLSPAEFGEMTLTEFSLAIDGFNELEAERLKWSFYNTRRICYYVLRPHLEKGSELREQDLFQIPDIDKEVEKMKEDLPVIKVVQDGGD
jgi:hypothetical protein